ncbi:hypothetical protein FHW83_005974 [Duganella sp. SG902]|uniref:hypothetical protein n=1 Tax=Duganella sp. SG902 TaxID=2587016 RepID=UPI00159D7B68|nr:hypothetical protein [Duganella sp. SG902]NVM80129.1 hypothetical protein [Duganella sp. SG902]
MHWLRNVALTTAAFGGSWGGAIWFWRETNRMPATSELVLYLLVLPVVLLSTWWLARKAWARVGAGAPAAAGAGDVAQAAAAETPAYAPLAPGLSIAASAVRAPHGDTVAELRAALAGNQARPGLDSELYDDDGYPILSARLKDAGDSALREELDLWRRARQLDDPRLDQAQWRALAAASAVTAELAAQASLHADLGPWQQQQQDRQQGRLAPNAAIAPAPPSLHLLPLWGEDWKPQQRELALQWLRHVATEAGWPQALLAPSPRDGDSAAPATADDAGAVLATLLEQCGHASRPCLALVIAAGSHMSDAAINRLSNQNALYTASSPQGRIPGEGAAGILLADAATASAIGTEGAVLQALHQGRRAASADEVRRDTDSCLTDAVHQALQATQVDGAAIALVAADTGHRTSRVTELMHVVTAAAPQLDPGADVVSVGASCGSCGAVTWLTALALADAEAQERAAPVLCISNEDPYRRYAALLRPAHAA